MDQTINPVKLKAAAEHLEWVLQQYPGSEEVQSLLLSLAPLIEDAKQGRILEPLDNMNVPGAYNFTDGRYIPFKHPNVDSAYVTFLIEMEGGLSEEELQLNDRLQAMRQDMLRGPHHE